MQMDLEQKDVKLQHQQPICIANVFKTVNLSELLHLWDTYKTSLVINGLMHDHWKYLTLLLPSSRLFVFVYLQIQVYQLCFHSKKIKNTLNSC